jgi:hypothetical protein
VAYEVLGLGKRRATWLGVVIATWLGVVIAPESGTAEAMSPS